MQSKLSHSLQALHAQPNAWRQPSYRSCPHTCRKRRAAVAAKKDESDGDPPVSPQLSSLEQTVRRKQAQVEAQLQELGMEGLEERLQSATQTPASPPYKLARLISEITQMQGRAAIVVEVYRSSPGSPESLLAMAKTAIGAGADALCVRCDMEDTPEATKDLFSVVQVVEAKEAGAAGVLGVIAQVNGRGTAVMSSFAAAIGMDAPVEVVNAMEMAGLEKAGVVFYAMNLQVGISISIPGFASDMAHGLLGHMPFGAISLVGVTSLEQAQKARASGADALMVKKEMIEAAAAEGKDLRTLLDQVLYLTSGDD